MTPFDDAVQTARANAEEWIVACTIATEVPPSPVQSSGSKEMFTAAMILVAQQAVAEVIANRLANPAFPKTAAGVVLQPKQFSGTLRGLSVTKGKDYWVDAITGNWFPQHVAECLQAWRRVQEMIRTGHDGRVVPGALYYYSPVTMSPPFRVPDWVSAPTPKQSIPCERISADYFRFYR